MSEDGRFEFIEGATGDLSLALHGRDASEVFRAAADALLAATVERVDAVERRTQRVVELRDTELDLLLRRFLNELVWLRDAEGLVLHPQNVRVRFDGEPELRAELAGEELDRERHGLEYDVKAATVHGLRIQATDDGWEASVTLDV